MTDKISILDIVPSTTVDGPGFRTSIYAAGCVHNCLGCHNPQSWCADNGRLYAVEELLRIVKEDELADVTFSGGDPLVQVEGFTTLARLIKSQTGKTIWCYTGFTFDSILSSPRLSRILPYVDVIVDGRYDESRRDADLIFRGSANQRIVDVRHTLLSGGIKLWNSNFR